MTEPQIKSTIHRCMYLEGSCGQDPCVVPLSAADEIEEIRQRNEVFKREEYTGDFTSHYMASPKTSLEQVGADIDRLLEIIAERDARFPEGMKYCKIVLKQCEAAHSWLTATNWVDHPCPWCSIAERDAEIARLKEEIEDERLNSLAAATHREAFSD
jgi:hypothetical protein